MAGALLVMAVAAASTANVSDLTACSTTMDGVTLVEGDLVLLKNQTTGTENGVYQVGKVASTTAPLTRHPDADLALTNGGGLRVSVRKGTISANEEYALTTTGAIVIGTTSIAFGRVSGGAAVATFTAGALTIQVGEGRFRYVDATAANSTLTLGTTGAKAGDTLDIARATAGAHTVAIVNGGAGAGTLMTMTASKVAGCRVAFDGTNWRLVGNYQEP